MLGLEFNNSTLFILLVGVCCILLLNAGFRSEGFKSGEPGIRCGVDMPNCPDGLQCLNGFCQKAVAPQLLDNELPVFPAL